VGFSKASGSDSSENTGIFVYMGPLALFGVTTFASDPSNVLNRASAAPPTGAWARQSLAENADSLISSGADNAMNGRSLARRFGGTPSVPQWCRRGANATL
jgi:hypothetical protein